VSACPSRLVSAEDCCDAEASIHDSCHASTQHGSCCGAETTIHDLYMTPTSASHVTVMYATIHDTYIRLTQAHRHAHRHARVSPLPTPTTAVGCRLERIPNVSSAAGVFVENDFWRHPVRCPCAGNSPNSAGNSKTRQVSNAKRGAGVMQARARHGIRDSVYRNGLEPPHLSTRYRTQGLGLGSRPGLGCRVSESVV
jgi:hypothetical protein